MNNKIVITHIFFTAGPNVGFDVAVGPSRTFLQYVGTWPDPLKEENIYSLFHAMIVSLSMLLFVIVPQTVKLIQVRGNLNTVIEILTNADLPIFMALIKFLASWYYRKVLKDLVKIMYDDWQREHSKLDFQEMWQRAQFSRKLSIGCISFTQGTMAAQFIESVVISITVHDKIERPTYISSYFPYNTQTSPIYEITWIIQFYSNLMGAIAFSSVDAFFIVLVLHLCGQLSVCTRALINLTNDLQQKSRKKEFTQKLANIVDRHNFLNRFAKTIEDSFNMMFIVQFTVLSVALCLVGFQLVIILTDNKGKMPLFQLIHMCYFTCCYLFSLFSYCYVAEQLNYASTEIHSAVYQIDWYNLSPEETKLLLLLMHRARKPFEITAGKFCILSLQLYGKILKTSGGYLSMLLAIRK